MRPMPGFYLMDTSAVAEFRRLKVPVSNSHGQGQMAVLDFGPQNRPVDLVFAHANGFNAHTYRRLLQGLPGHMRIWAPDLRGHGLSDLPTRTQGRLSWHDHRDDLVSLLNTLEEPVALCGHSIGGVSGLLAAAQVPQKVSSLVMLDPVIWPRSTVGLFHLPGFSAIPARSPIVKSTLRRRDRFDSRDQAFASWQGRGAFKGWPDEVLRDYLVDGLAEDGDGVRLTCSPQWEASNYSAQSHNPWKALRHYSGPVTLLRAGVASLCSVTNENAGPNLSIRTVEGGGHLFPMTHPEVVHEVLSGLAK